MDTKTILGLLQRGLVLAGVALAVSACNPKPITPIVTVVSKSVATLEKTSGLGLSNCMPESPTPPNTQSWWAALPVANHQHPFAGWETWRNGAPGCSQSRIDVYRALVTFNMASVSNLKGLVQKAELIVNTRAIPAGARRGGAVTVGPFGNPTSVTLLCPELIGGAGTLQRFGPAAAGTLPTVSAVGELVMLGADPFPAGQMVYTFPLNMDTPGPIAGATSPTTGTANGTGGAIFSSDVTGAVNAALNGNFAGLSWMLTSNFEGPLPGAIPVTGNIDCKTSYDLDLRITHL